MPKLNYKQKRILGTIFINAQTIRWATQGRMLRKIWKSAPTIQSPVCLDVGCGGGSYAIENFLSQGFLATLCEYDEGRLDLAKRQVAEAHLFEKASFVQCSAEALPFSDATYDHIQCMEVLEHLQNPKKALEEFRRVAKQNARLVISVPHPPEWFHNPDHVVEGYIAPEITALVESAGWQVLSTEYCMLIGTRLVCWLESILRIPLPFIPFIMLENLIPKKWRCFLLPYDIIVISKIK